MADWDDDEPDELVAKKLSSCWDDDLVDTVPDAWDAEEPKTQPKPAPAKLSLEERIRIKEEKRRKEKEEKLRQQEEEKAMQAMTERERQRMAEEAEVDLLRDTFGGEPTVQKMKSDGIDDFDPQTKEDFNRLNELMKQKMKKFEKSPHYSSFIETLMRDAAPEVDIDVLKSINTSILVLIAEKQKLAKGKSKKKTKGKLVVERDDDYNIDGGAAIEPDEYDDFM